MPAARASLPAGLVVAGLLYLLATTASAGSTPPGLILQWGQPGTGPGQFSEPVAADVTPTGTVVVVDAANHRVQVYSPTGALLHEWGTGGSAPGQFSRPTGIAVDRHGHVFVADQLNDRIQKFDGAGNHLLTWGSLGYGGGEFLRPRDVAVDRSGNVYVCDYANSRVQKFDPSGNFLLSWGTYGIAAGQFVFPEGIAVSASDEVYVTDTGNRRIQVFGLDGTFRRLWGNTGALNQRVEYPVDIDLDSTGAVLVTDLALNQVLRFTPTGGILTSWGGSPYQSPMAVAVDDLNNVYVVDSEAPQVFRYGPGPTTPPCFVMRWAQQGSGLGELSHSRGLAVDAEGFIYSIGGHRPQVKKYDPGGTLLLTWGRSVIPDENLSSPRDLAVGGTSVYVSDAGTNDRIRIFTRQGQYQGFIPVPHPQGIAVDSSGNLYVTSSVLDHVQKFSPTGVLINTWGSTGSGPGQFDQPSGIAIQASSPETILVVDFGNHRVQMFDLGGSYQGEFGSYGSGPGEFDHPRDVASDSSGNLWVVDTGNDRVQKFFGDTYLATLGSEGTGFGQFTFPKAVAVIPGGLLVTDSNHGIQRFGEAPFSLESNTLSTATGRPMRLRAFGGEPYRPAALLVTAVNGLPTTSQPLVFFSFDVHGTYNYAPTVPQDPTLPGLTLTLQALSLNSSGFLQWSTTEDVMFH